MAPSSLKRAPTAPGPKMSSMKPQSKATKNTGNGGQIKTKRRTPDAGVSKSKRQRKRTYTDKELDLPTLNTITPAGVQKPSGRKKGKTFVDDTESMRTILAIVSAEREGRIESKMQKARQMEEIRESRRAELEKKEHDKQWKLDELKNRLRRNRRNKGKGSAGKEGDEGERVVPSKMVARKTVSFG